MGKLKLMPPFLVSVLRHLGVLPYRYNFDSRARYYAMLFKDPKDAKHLAQVESNRRDPKLHVQTALAWHEAGRFTPALQQLAEVWECEPSEEYRLITLC